MTSILVTAFFLFAAVFALNSLFATWRDYGPAALALRKQFRNCAENRDIRWKIASVEVTRVSAKILRPRFMRQVASSLPVAA